MIGIEQINNFDAGSIIAFWIYSARISIFQWMQWKFAENTKSLVKTVSFNLVRMNFHRPMTRKYSDFQRFLFRRSARKLTFVLWLNKRLWQYGCWLYGCRIVQAPSDPTDAVYVVSVKQSSSTTHVVLYVCNPLAIQMSAALTLEKLRFARCLSANGDLHWIHLLMFSNIIRAWILRL